MCVDTTSQRLWNRNILDTFYAKSVILEIQATVDDNYGKLQFAFNNFWIILKKTCQQQKVSAKPKWQATLTNMFSRASSSK